ARLGEGHVDVVVQDDRESDLARKIEYSIQCGIGEARRLAGDLGGYELLVDRELADAAEDPRKQLEHPPDVIDSVHVRRVEASDHGIEARLLLLRQRLVYAGDIGIGEGVVIERRVGAEVVGRSVVAGIYVGPLLLQRDTKERRTPDLVAH